MRTKPVASGSPCSVVQCQAVRFNTFDNFLKVVKCGYAGITTWDQMQPQKRRRKYRALNAKASTA